MQLSKCSISSARLARGRAAQRIVCVAKPQAKNQVSTKKETKLMSSAVPIATIAAAEGIRDLLLPQAEYFKTLNLPEALVHWGHPGNMAVVLFAMGGYGAAYLGWQIRTATDGDLIAKAKDMHPKLAAGMFFFFAAGASGGMMSLLMQDKPILESPHAITGLAGLALLSVQAVLPAAFASGGASARTAHAYLGSGILALFLVHAVLGLQLGLSF